MAALTGAVRKLLIEISIFCICICTMYTIIYGLHRTFMDQIPTCAHDRCYFITLSASGYV